MRDEECGQMTEKSTKTGKVMEDAKTDDPVKAEGGNESVASEIHATTAINSSVKPEEYPKADRSEQVRAATGKPVTKNGK